MKVIFCLPGQQFSGRFLDGWMDLVGYRFARGMHFAVSQRESPNVYYVRNLETSAFACRPGRAATRPISPQRRQERKEK